MADFIDFEATTVADENQENMVVGNIDDDDEEVSDIDSLDSFIDNEHTILQTIDRFIIS